MTGPLDPLNRMRAEMGELDPESRARVPDRQQQTIHGPMSSNRWPASFYAGGLLALVAVVGVSVWGIVSSTRVDGTAGRSDGIPQDDILRNDSELDLPPVEQDDDGAGSFDPVTPPEFLADLSGVWEGPAEGDQDWYDVQLSIAATGGDWSIQIDYPQAGCGGVLVPNEVMSDGEAMELAEQLTYGDDLCVDNATVYLRRAGSDQLYWEWIDGWSHIWAYLSYIGPLDVEGSTAAATSDPGDPTFQVSSGKESRYSSEYAAQVTDVAGDGLFIDVKFRAAGLFDLRRPETSCLRIEGVDGLQYVALPSSMHLSVEEPTNYTGKLTFPALISGEYYFNYSCASDYSLARLGPVTVPSVGVSRYSEEYYAVILGISGDTLRFASHGPLDLRDPGSSCLTNGSEDVMPRVALDVNLNEYSLTYAGAMAFDTAPPGAQFLYSCSNDYTTVPL